MFLIEAVSLNNQAFFLKFMASSEIMLFAERVVFQTTGNGKVNYLTDELGVLSDCSCSSDC